MEADKPPRFRNDMAVPPGGLYFYDIDTPTGAVHFEDPAMHVLEAKILRFCDANSRPVPVDIFATVQEYMCPRLPDGFCNTSGTRSITPGLTLQGVKDMTRLIVRRAASGIGSFLAPIDEANRRAKICMTCPLNNAQGCTVCSGLLQMVRQLVGRRETQYDRFLGTCTLCGCMLRVKCHVSADGLRSSTTPPPIEKVPAHCWLRNVYRYGNCLTGS